MMQCNTLWQRRRATVKINKYKAQSLNIQEAVYNCHVLGLFQYSNGADEAQPYFICELYSGTCLYADPDDVTFVDTNEKGEIVG